MANLVSFVICESINNMPAANMGVVPTLVAPQVALRPQFIPGNFSFGISVGLTGIDLNKVNKVRFTIKNPDNNSEINEMNKHLQYIADSEKCEFGDVSVQKIWNPKATIEAASFIRSIGFVHPLRIPNPLSDLIKAIFCSEVYA